MGDVWKITVTGKNVASLQLKHTYYKNGSWIAGEHELSETRTDDMFEIYFTAKEDWPMIGFMIHNGSGDEVIIENVHIVKVG